jgi:predicted transcriptional regulator
MAKRRIIKEKPSKLLDVRLVIQVGMILFAIVGFYFTTKSRLDVIENNMSEIKSSLTDSRLVKLEMRLEELNKEIKRVDMNLMSLEDWIDEDILGNIMQQK